MSLNYDVIVVGSYSVDLIFSGLGELPQLGKDVVGKDFKMTPGEAFISAVSMHRLGIKVGWAADFGSDDFSQFALRCAREEGLDESLFVFHDRSYRRISVAATYPNDRAFITYYDPDPQVPAAVSAIIRSKARLLFIPGLYTGELLRTGRKLIRAKEMKLVMDGNSSSGDIIAKTRDSNAIRKAIKSVDIFLPNALEARRLTGEQNLNAAILQLGELCPIVVIKDGSNGSLAYSNQKFVHMPAISVDPVDTTGAGDNFNAGFLYAWLEGQSIETCMKWGNIVGGLSTTAMGGTVRRITCDQVRTILSSWTVQ
jgi:sugar/nucleoside kinase (ribokinase family)